MTYKRQREVLFGLSVIHIKSNLERTYVQKWTTLHQDFIKATIKEQSADMLQRVRNNTAIVVNQKRQESRSDLTDELEEQLSERAKYNEHAF